MYNGKHLKTLNSYIKIIKKFQSMIFRIKNVVKCARINTSVNFISTCVALVKLELENFDEVLEYIALLNGSWITFVALLNVVGKIIN